MKKYFFLCFANVLISLIAFSQTQTIRGTVTDEWQGQPLVGASVFLVLADSIEVIGTVTDQSGRYRLEGVPIGRQQLKISYLGYETALLSELLVETGKEFIQDVQLSEATAALQAVVVQAKGKHSMPHPLSIYTMKVEEQFRYPTTYYDPARLATTLPGVTGVDDQGNNISVRGNSPASLKWRLEGVEIVNPNHTANAGTFSDRPTAAGGGVNILSAQLLGTSNFLTGTFPAGYGNALGGIMDMYFRNGNDEQQEFTAQASVIGLEAAAEGPIGSSQSALSFSLNQGRPTGSYLINYRYSFVGILTAAGADFGGEKINFQDLSFHFNFPILKNAEIGFFGVGGQSKNVYDTPADENNIAEEKELFNIDFNSKMGAAGVILNASINKKIKLNTTVVYSGLEHKRFSEKIINVPEPTLWSDDIINESKLAFSSKLFYKKNTNQNYEIGVQASREETSFNSFFTDNFGAYGYGEKINGWLFQPYFNSRFYLNKKLKLNAGLHGHYFTYSPDHFLLLPRASLSYFLNKKQQINLAYSWQAQTQQTQVYAASLLDEKNIGPTQSQQIAASFQHRFKKGAFIKSEIYYQYIFDVPVSVKNNSTFSILNNIENLQPLQDTLNNNGKGRNYGIDIYFEQPILKNNYARLGASLYRSFYTDNNGVERPTRFDGRYLINYTYGSEKTKKKTKKTVIRGYSSRISYYGGFRQTPIFSAASVSEGRTVFQEFAANSKKLKNYFRIDFRFYLKWQKPNHSTTFSIDLQNITGTKNEAYQYFDQVQQKVVTRKQLGFIPLIAYRVEF